MSLKEQLIDNFDKLPPEKQHEVIDFVEYLALSQLDETTYLLSTEANKKHLLESINQAKKGENLVEVDWEELKKGNFSGS